MFEKQPEVPVMNKNTELYAFGLDESPWNP